MPRPIAPAPKRAPQPKCVFAAVALIIAAGAWLLWPSGGDVANLESRATAIVAFGDSLTAGYGAGEGSDYPAVLSAELDRPIVNAGRSGDTTADAVARLDADVLSLNPRLVIVGLGGNDFLRGEPIARTEENLRTIVKRIQAQGAMVVLLGFEFPSISANYGAMYERIANEESCLLIEDVLAGILNDAKLKSDEIHPNAAGYALMAERIAGPLEKLLQKADRAR